MLITNRLIHETLKAVLLREIKMNYFVFFTARSQIVPMIRINGVNRNYIKKIRNSMKAIQN
jgi:hypothetical protein